MIKQEKKILDKKLFYTVKWYKNSLKTNMLIAKNPFQQLFISQYELLFFCLCSRFPPKVFQKLFISHYINYSKAI